MLKIGRQSQTVYLIGVFSRNYAVVLQNSITVLQTGVWVPKNVQDMKLMVKVRKVCRDDKLNFTQRNNLSSS